jgi:membrane protein
MVICAHVQIHMAQHVKILTIGVGMNWRYYVMAAKKFQADSGILHASALTFDTLFAVVPILATAFAISRGFGLQAYLAQQLDKTFAGQEDMINALSQYAQNLLAHTSGGVILGVAVAILLFSVYVMLNHIEMTLDKIWQVPSRRSLNVRVNHYLSLALTAPLILITAGSVKLFISKKIESYGWMLAFTAQGVSTILYILFFIWLFKYVPNIKVTRKAVLFGGIQTGIAFVIMQTFLIESQALMSNYGAIYGSLAAFPIFLIFVDLSWILVLYGTQLCFVFQNNIRYNWQIDVNRLSYNKRMELMLKITTTCIEQFKNNKPALTVKQIASQVGLPKSCTLQLLLNLVAANVLLETQANKTLQEGFVPAHDPELLDDTKIIEAINNCGVDKI